MKQNDKSSFTGLILMAAILIIFNVFVFNNAEEISENENTETIHNSENSNTVTETTISNSTEESIETTETLVEQDYILENDKIKLIFSNKKGEIKSAIVKGFYTYDEYRKNLDDNSYQSKDVEIFNNKNSDFTITADRGISTNEFFSVSENNNSITFRKDYENNAFIEYTYTLEDNTNFADFTINSEGINNPELVWTIATPQTEKSKDNQKEYTGFYYQESYSKDVDYTWDNDKFEVNAFNTELSWIAFKQQFFSTIITSKKNNFNNNTEFQINVNEEDEYIKTLSLRTELEEGENNYSIYFGDNDYNKLKSYNTELENIIPLGWGIFGWVNRVIIINIFDFLQNTSGISSFGLIILLLTLIIKISLAPFTYKSYLSQAKMKVLKPEIDKITEKHKEKDPMKSQKETMGLYRKAGVNPMGGVLTYAISVSYINCNV
ncbi:YidC/Oxa1 family membrane protein insertase [Flavobacteriales bacterium]|nr:YidC/Oxa1 family membrane protein insertase [Flavobacteriales bacterium]